MNIKPPLAPAAKKAGTFARLFSGVLLGGFNLLLLLVALAIYIVPMQEQVTPVELYHRTWQTAADHAYDTAKLKDWAAWEHKYDSQIKTDEDAIKFANEMLESTGDHYASLLPPEAVKAQDERSSGEFAGIGVGVEAKVDQDGKPVMAADPNEGPLMLTDDSGYPLIKEVKIGGPAMQAGMRDGDAIVSINGVSAKDATIKSMVTQMRGKVGEEVTVVVTRGGKNVTLKIVRGVVKTEVVSSKMLTAANGKQVGYIRLEHFLEQDAADEMAAAIGKFGFPATLIGAALGGVLAIKFGMMRTLMLGAILSAASNLLFSWLATLGHDLTWLTVVISIDNLSAGIASSTFIAYMSSLTNISYSATQYALLSSIMLLFPKWLAGFSGVAVDAVGYHTFFIGTALIGVPVLVLIWIASRRLQHQQLSSKT
mgnify:CR=1 FL=1